MRGKDDCKARPRIKLYRTGKRIKGSGLIGQVHYALPAGTKDRQFLVN